MKTTILAFILLAANHITGQAAYDFSADNTEATTTTSSSNFDEIGNNGFNFDLIDAGVNSKYSEFGSGFFRNKLIMVSSKKLGGFAKIDANTNEAYKELYCLDVGGNGNLSSPILFSRILNTASSEDQLWFTADQNTVYYTRSERNNSLEFKLYKAELEANSHGNWVNHEAIAFNEEGVSIENPYVDSEGKKIYFASNRSDSYGGFDLYSADIKADGSLGTPKNLGPSVNTSANEKYPSLSKDGKYLYFSSTGHNNIGGYDVFVSRILKDGFKTPRNMGNTINSQYNEVAYFLAAKNKGYVSSDKPNGKGGYDMYIATNDEVIQTMEGSVLDLETKTELPNTIVTIYDEDGNEVSKQTTDENGTFEFDVVPFEVYSITASKEGFVDNTYDFTATKGFNTKYTKNLELESAIPPVDPLALEIDHIYFDTAKWTIKEESYSALDKVIEILTDFPDKSLFINAHTDNVGTDAYNLRLSLKRAAATVEYLVDKGISEDRLDPKGFGEAQPKEDCKATCSPQQLETNRRVEFVIKK
jgi:outer membrane protein OmpA-like peptidoglycan-associated protein